MSFKKGEIIEGTNRAKEAARHPIVFISEHEEGLFLGVMLTHQKNLNIQFDDEHFETKPETNRKGDSFFVKRILIKDKTWGPFEVIGRLSKAGIAYMEENISENDPILWEEVIAEING